MKKIINLLLCLTSACLMMAVSSCSHPSSSSSGSSSGSSSKKYNLKVELVSEGLFDDTDTHVYYIKTKSKTKYDCYSDPDCINKLGDDVIEAKNLTTNDGSFLKFKHNSKSYELSIYTDGSKKESYSYLTTDTSKWLISSLKVNDKEYKKNVDFTIEIKITKPDDFICNETWYLMKNYDGPEDFTDTYLIFTDSACSQEKVFASGIKPSAYATTSLKNSNAKLYLVIGSDTITIKLNSDKHYYNAPSLPGSIGIGSLKINGTQYCQEVN